MTNVLFLRDQPKPIKHLTFHPSGSYIAASCTDGIVYVYSTTTTTPELVQKVDGLIRPLETDAEASSCSVWHPDGRALAAPTATRDIQVMSRSDWEKQRAFSGGHMGDITALAWSPNGALLATAGADRKILLWETKTQKIVARYVFDRVPMNGINQGLDTTMLVSPISFGILMKTLFLLLLRRVNSSSMKTLWRQTALVSSKTHSIQLLSFMTHWLRHPATHVRLSLMASKIRTRVELGDEARLILSMTSSDQIWILTTMIL